ncbi:MAG: GNAT family N-acetyltransferase [Rhodocyclaceae bacterium]|nr:GNAT family N-acetyltransferase [Rhodocyclaceae bacterium]
MTVLRARAADAPQLSALAFRSKAMWGYGARFIHACRGELHVGAATLGARDRRCLVARHGGSIRGFCMLVRETAHRWELDALFVSPEAIRHGIGRALMRAACQRVARDGARELLIQSDPHAEGFYRKLGAAAVGRRASDSIPGRHLPLLRLRLRARSAQRRRINVRSE